MITVLLVIVDIAFVAAFVSLYRRKTAPALILSRPWKGYEKKAKEEGWQALPFSLDADKAARFAGDWLAEADRGQWPDNDGTGAPDAFTVRGGKGLGYNHGAVEILAVIIPECSVYGK